MKKGIIFLVAIFLFTLGSCKKYPEGGFLYRGEKLLLRHSWFLENYQVNGFDSTAFIDFNGNDNYKTISFIKDGKYSSTIGCNVGVGGGNECSFADNNRTFKTFTTSHNSVNCTVAPQTIGCYKVIFCPEGVDMLWTIDKLTSKEFILHSDLKNS